MGKATPAAAPASAEVSRVSNQARKASQERDEGGGCGFEKKTPAVVAKKPPAMEKVPTVEGRCVSETSHNMSCRVLCQETWYQVSGSNCTGEASLSIFRAFFTGWIPSFGGGGLGRLRVTRPDS